ncbi:hypothetical protein ACIPYQ_40120 [Streptomyces sp. NPDC090045]|uniref:hypothetical protein n=1 Tax=Streptomyces sp. NPDC090045 TaxID=3365927 RepID=UPI00381B1944
MTATRTRRVVPLLIVTLLAGGGASLSSTAFAAPTTTTASVTTDTDTDSPRTVKHIAKKPRIVKSIRRDKQSDGEYGVLNGGQGGNGGDGNNDDCPADASACPVKAGDAYTTERENVLWTKEREMSKVHNEL